MTERTNKRKRTGMLTDDQKKKHHIESEHKRRQAIRDAFSKLVDIVPELEPSDSRSEILVLNKTSEYLNKLFQDHVDLVKLLESKGVSVDDGLRLKNIPEFKNLKSRD